MSDLINKLGALFPSSFRSSGLITSLMFLICLTAVQSASAATYTVMTTADGGAGSLRAAIESANGTLDSDTIEFAIPASDSNCTAGVCTIKLTSGELAITSAATAGTLLITNSTSAGNLLISRNDTSRVFFVNSGANLTINGVTITRDNGTGTTNSVFMGVGAGIYNSGITILTNSIVSGNKASHNGGGIYNYYGATMTLTNSTVSGNWSGFGGGGISNNGTMTLTNSTISGNSSTIGGGIYNGAALTLTNSTVSGNKASSAGGGIINEDTGATTSGITTLTNSTVSGNWSDNGGGIYIYYGTLNLTSVTVTQNQSTKADCTGCPGGITNFGGTANLNNTIVAGNTAANASAPPDLGAEVAAGSSFNLVGNGLGTTGISNGDANSNQVGSSASPIDPRLGALADNGGATQTHALLFGSPALDKGNSFSLTTDQRGFARPVNLDDATYPNATDGDNSDIGAFEAQTAPLGTTAAAVSISGRVMTASGRGIGNVRLTLTDTNGQIRTAMTTSFGYYRFDNVLVGETYILLAVGKRYTFSQSLRVLSINGETDAVNFIAD
ncbi:MAG TPA: choice-of-anchor Q domain-containing protein [Pyrinomonadaceae bacterium]|jgi:parallel beta-helix repeat protein